MLLLGGCAGFEQKIFDWGVSYERYRADLSYGTVRLDKETSIAFLERKGEGETIVLVHGFGANKDTWDIFIRYLPEKFHVLVIDLPGHGDSSRHMHVSYDIQYMADALSRTVDTVGVRRFHLAGHSLGGYVAMYYAAGNPGKVVTLGLFASGGILAPKPTAFQRTLEEGKYPMSVDSAESFDRMMGLIFYNKPFIPWPVRSVVLRQTIALNAFEEKMWRDIWKTHPDGQNLLKQLHMPVFLLWGDQDRIMDVSCVKVYRKYLPQAKTAIIKDCGHALIFERPKEAARLYARFLKEEASTGNSCKDNLTFLTPDMGSGRPRRVGTGIFR